MALGPSGSSDNSALRRSAGLDVSGDELLGPRGEELELKSLVLDGLADGIMVHTMDGELLYFNPAAATIYGYSAEEFAALEPYGWVPPQAREPIGARVAVLRTSGVLDFESTGRTAEGGTIATEVHARVIELPGHGQAIVSVIQNITERLAAIETIRHLAFHDTLTGLPNRVLLDERLRMAMSNADRYGDTVGVVFLDLDAFKPVNDTFGHAVGDRVLVTVAERLVSCVREHDTVARMGGDEFLVLFPRLSSGRGLIELGRKLEDRISESFVVDGTTVRISAKVGLAVYRIGEAPDELIGRADRALYRAKAHGVPGWSEFEPQD